MTAKLDKLILDLNGKKIELTLAEVKQLKAALGEILGEDRVVTIPAPYPVPYHPYVYRRPYVWDEYPTITWSTKTNVSGMLYASGNNTQGETVGYLAVN